MQLPSDRFALKARYIFPVAGPPLADAAITIDRGRIESVSRKTPHCDTIDLGNVAILPGLVNAHTHLEFSDLAVPLGSSGMALPDWIRQLVQHRRRTGAAGNDSDIVRNHAVQRGLSESIAAGVTTLGEIAGASWPRLAFSDSAINSTIFLELLGLSPARIEPLIQSAREHLELAADDACWHAGLSPHAPYTVHPELLQQACQISATAKIPLAMHLAESPQELELLAWGNGPFVDLLKDLGAWDPAAIPPGTGILDYLERLAAADRALVVHGNYLNSQEIEFLAARPEKMAVVYCPRTHAYFGHSRYSLAKMIDRGVTVALGTDSRASNPDLNLLSEMRFMARHHSDLRPDEIVKMATLGGAKALGCDSRCGSLAPGKQADLAVVRLPQRESPPHELLLDSDEPVTMTIVAGRLAWSAG